MMKFIFGVQININVFYSDTIILGVYSQACPRQPKLKVCISLQYLQKNVGDKVDFLPADKHKNFLQVDSITLSVHRHVYTSHAQSTQNDKFAISLQYLKKNVNDEVYDLPADKCQSFPQIDTIILGVCGQACPNYSK